MHGVKTLSIAPVNNNLKGSTPEDFFADKALKPRSRHRHTKPNYDEERSRIVYAAYENQLEPKFFHIDKGPDIDIHIDTIFFLIYL